MSHDALVMHNQDPDAHDLTAIRRRLDVMEPLLGIWQVVARDSFSGADGPLTAAATGQQWVVDAPRAMPSRIGGRCRSPGGTASAVIEGGFSDGQIEAGLDPGTGQAAMLVRYKDAVNYLSLARKPDSIALVKVIQDQGSNIVLPIGLPYAPGERLKLRFVGSRIWLFCDEALLCAADEPALATSTRYGLRLIGNGSANGFRLTSRTAL